MASRNRKTDKDQPKSCALPSVWQRAFTSQSQWPDKDEFLDVIYWSRQIIATVLGLLWGIIPLKGFLGIAIFGALNAGILYVYFGNYQRVDEEEFGGLWELTKEGFMSSFALFLVTWIIVYSAIYFD